MVLKKSVLLVSLIVLGTSLTGCNSNSLNNSLPQFYNANNTVTAPPVTVKVVLDSPPFATGANNELSGIAKMDDGKIVKYMTAKTGGKAVAITTIYASKWVKLESHSTTASEAETILKLARQGGFANEYKELKTRYTELGLI